MIGGERQSTISPTSFAVAPELIGLPLAGGGRRLVAILIDLALVGLLLKAGSVVFGIAAALAMLRASYRWTSSRRRTVLALRIGAAFILFLCIMSIWRYVRSTPEKLAAKLEQQISSGGDDDGGATVKVGGTKTSVSVSDIVEGVVEFNALNHAGSDAEARPLADRLVARLKAKGLGGKDMREMRASLEHDSLDSATRERSGMTNLTPVAKRNLLAALVALDTVSTLKPEVRARRDSLAVAYSRALRTTNRETADSLRNELFVALAGDTIEHLKDDLSDARKQNKDLTESRMNMQKQPLVEVLKGVFNDLGLGFGWLALYFTACLALMKGQTPGKRLMGIRVVRLDGKPIGWWSAFERFGGYSASVITGLLGFAQLLWDRNRQALHDKISETVVIRQ
jgi:hypothetical protein